MAASDTSSDAAPTRSATPASCTGIAWAWARFRNDLPAAASDSASTTSVGVVAAGGPQFRSNSTACRVDGSSNLVASNTASDSRSACSDSTLRSAARRALRLTLTV